MLIIKVKHFKTHSYNLQVTKLGTFLAKAPWAVSTKLFCII
jgi:hypothetical protein